MRGMRAAIEVEQFDRYRQETKEGWTRGDIAPL
jgi:hypothetical protein